MLTGFFIAYVALTLPLMVAGFMRAWRNRTKTSAVATETANEFSRLEKILKQSFGGDVKLVEIPHGVVEATSQTSQKMMTMIDESNRIVIAWLTGIRNTLDTNKRDMDAVLIALKAMSEAILAFKPAPEKESKGLHLDKFLNELRYADRFAKTETQKKALMGIISNVEKTYGNGTK